MKAFLASRQAQWRAGIRRLLVISGEPDWCAQQAQRLTAALRGDVPWISQQTAARGLLGQEAPHAVFDARDGLDVEALAMLAGALRAGGWLLLLTPEWTSWPQRPDADSLRWCERAEPIATPRFIHHFQQALLADAEVTLWRQGQPLSVTPPELRPPWQPAHGGPTAGQRAILRQLDDARHAVYVVTAPRGRGKSTLAGLFARQRGDACWVTAPSRASSDVLLQHAGDRTRFWAPDALLAYCRQSAVRPDWLLIDEAAAIPIPLLAALLPHFRHVLITTTVQGYEGTGRGFLLKFCDTLPDWRELTLSEPLRWAPDDPLERVLDNALLFNSMLFNAMLFNAEKSVTAVEPGSVAIVPERRKEWLRQPERLAQFYGLLCSAHYRTSPLDLRRLMDAPGQHCARADLQGAPGGVVWLVDEGGLDAALAKDVWAGRRRPRGNLVVQSLAAHGYGWQAPLLRSRRVCRIAVPAALRGRRIGAALVAAQREQALREGLDFLSVSFGFQPDLWRFWQRCGFQLARIGSHIEASSGCYAAMALLPLNAAGQQLTQEATAQFARDWRWLRQGIALTLELPEDADIALTPADWRNLAGFAFAHRPPEACLASLCRLLAQSAAPVPALRLWLERRFDVEQCAAQLRLSGRRALLQRWRAETADALRQLDAAQTQRWQAWIGP